jgi:hypothetical protein
LRSRCSAKLPWSSSPDPRPPQWARGHQYVFKY